LAAGPRCNLALRLVGCWGKLEADAATVLGIRFTGDQSGLGEPVRKFDRAVVADAQPFGEVADTWVGFSRRALDRQQRLVLAWRQARLGGGGFAEFQEAAELIAEFGQPPVVLLVQPPCHQRAWGCMEYIVMRCIGHLQGENNHVTDTALPSAGTGVADHATRAGIRHLGDFTTSPHVLLIAAIALVVGTGGVIAGVILLNLIRLCTNVAYYGVFSWADLKPAGSPFGVASVLVPVVGALIIGFMARYGSEKIGGHGIPDAIEAILLGRSRLDLKVAILKPLSSAVSIGTGGPFGAEGPIIMTGGAIAR